MRYGSLILSALMGMLLALPSFAQSDWQVAAQSAIGRVTPDTMSHQWPGIASETDFVGDTVLVGADTSSAWRLFIDDRLVTVIAQVTLNQNDPSDSLDAYFQQFKLDSDGPHHLRLEKMNETQYAVGQVPKIIVADSTTTSAPVPRARRIAFYGDSLTVGYGNMWPTGGGCAPEVVHPNTNTSLAYPVLAAKHFNADYQIMAFSGLGLVRNYGGFEHDKYRLPLLMDRTLFDDATVYSDDFEPQIIHINIGSNDFSTPIHEGEKWKDTDEFIADFTKTYIAFVERLRAENPTALIIIATPYDADQSKFGTTIETIYAKLSAKGMTNIERLNYGHTEDTGCNGHPSLRDHEALAQTLITRLERHSEIWNHLGH